jgi:hypothetical protein
MRQFKGADWTLNDQFSIQPEYLRKSIGYIKGLFTAMINKVQNQQQAQRPGGTTAQPPNGQPTIPLNASNLQQLQQQEEAIQRARRQSQAVPAAPTAAQPPFPLGAPSPQGVPQAYGTGGFSPEKLKIPPSKRRKPSHAGGTTPTTPGTGLAAQAKPEASKPSTVETKSFTCAVPECEYHRKGLPTQAALEKHTEESHKPEEHIDDPLQYALDSFKVALVDPDKEKEKAQRKAPKKPPTAADAQRAATKPVTGPTVKQEVKVEGTTPVTAGTTPMGRVSSQVGPKSVSPASNQLPTPRMAAGKAPASSNLRPTPSKDVKREPGKAADETVPSDDTQLKDAWADSALSLDLISEAFDAARTEDFYGLRGDPFDEFLNADMFTLEQAEDTPDSIDSGGAVTQTPKDGDLSKEDALIKIGGPEDDNWLPADWFSHPGALAGDPMIIDNPWVDIDWNALERKEIDPVMGDDGSLTFFSG